MKETKKSDEPRKMVTRTEIAETDECIDMEVDGLGTEFLSEEESDIGENLDSASEVIFNERSLNNNAIGDQLQSNMDLTRSSCDSRAETVQINSQDKKRAAEQAELKEEEAFFDRLSDYMQRKGLAFTSTASVVNGKETTNGKNQASHGKGPDQGKSQSNLKQGMDTSNFDSIVEAIGGEGSEITIYQSAVKRASEEGQLDRCFSSSDEENMNISNESDQSNNMNKYPFNVACKNRSADKGSKKRHHPEEVHPNNPHTARSVAHEVQERHD